MGYLHRARKFMSVSIICALSFSVITACDSGSRSNFDTGVTVTDPPPVAVAPPPATPPPVTPPPVTPPPMNPEPPTPDPTPIDPPPIDPLTTVVATMDENGGQMTSVDGTLTIAIPAGALSSPVDIGIRQMAPSELEPTELLNLPLGQLYELTPDGLEFSMPIQVTVNEVTSVPVEDKTAFESAFNPVALLSVSGGVVDPLSNITIRESDAGILVSGDLSHFSSLIVYQQTDLVIERSTPAIGVVGGVESNSRVRARRINNSEFVGRFSGMVFSVSSTVKISPDSTAIISDVESIRAVELETEGNEFGDDIFESFGVIRGTCISVGSASFSIELAVIDQGLETALREFLADGALPTAQGFFRARQVKTVIVKLEVRCTSPDDVSPQLPDAKFIDLDSPESVQRFGKPPYKNFPAVNTEQLFAATGQETKILTATGETVQSMEVFGPGKVGALAIQPSGSNTDFLFEFGGFGLAISPLDGGITTASNGNFTDARHPMGADGQPDFAQLFGVNFSDNSLRRFSFDPDINNIVSDELLDGNANEVVDGKLISVDSLRQTDVLAVTDNGADGEPAQLLFLSVSNNMVDSVVEIAEIVASPRRIRCGPDFCAISHVDENSGSSTLTVFSVASVDPDNPAAFAPSLIPVDSSPITIDITTTPTGLPVIVSTSFVDQTATATVLNLDGTPLEQVTISLGDMGVVGSAHTLFLTTSEIVTRTTPVIFSGFDSNNVVILPLGIFEFTDARTGLTP